MFVVLLVLFILSTPRPIPKHTRTHTHTHLPFAPTARNASDCLNLFVFQSSNVTVTGDAHVSKHACLRPPLTNRFCLPCDRITRSHERRVAWSAWSLLKSAATARSWHGVAMASGGEQKVVLITGCSSGIGLRIAVLLARDERKRYHGKRAHLPSN